MSIEPQLVVQVPRGGEVDRRLSAQAPPSVASGQVVIDVGPTVLNLFGVAVPDYMDGKAWAVGDAAEKAQTEKEEALAEVV